MTKSPIEHHDEVAFWFPVFPPAGVCVWPPCCKGVSAVLLCLESDATFLHDQT